MRSSWSFRDLLRGCGDICWRRGTDGKKDNAIVNNKNDVTTKLHRQSLHSNSSSIATLSEITPVKESEAKVSPAGVFKRALVLPAVTEEKQAKEQKALFLHGPKQKYTLEDHDIPRTVADNEVLLRVTVIGLNPIDWKAPDYNFGIPSFPFLGGRDLVGVVVQAPKAKSHLRVGDVVASVSTDYRDHRKAAYQQYAISTVDNAWRIPAHFPEERAAAVGVAFVTAVFALGACLGVRFGSIVPGATPPDLFQLFAALDPAQVPEDVRSAVQDRISEDERPRRGDWIAIWGGSSATGAVAVQLAKSAGLRVVCVADLAKHGAKLVDLGAADLLIDRADPQRAVTIIQEVTDGQLRFALDIVGKETAGLLRSTLRQGHNEAASSSSSQSSIASSHIVGLTGLPKTSVPGVRHHSVPIKLFHLDSRTGSSIMLWLEQLLCHSKTTEHSQCSGSSNSSVTAAAALDSSTSLGLTTPQVVVAHGALDGVNGALNEMRADLHSGKRVVVPLQQHSDTVVYS